MNRVKQLASVLESTNFRGRSVIVLIIAVLAVVSIVPLAARNSTACNSGSVNWCFDSGTNDCAEMQMCQTITGQFCTNGKEIQTAKVVQPLATVNRCGFKSGTGSCTETEQPCETSVSYTDGECLQDCTTTFVLTACRMSTSNWNCTTGPVH